MPSFIPPDRLLLGPGPSNVPPRILGALARPTIGHLDPQFVRMMDELKALLLLLSPVAPHICEEMWQTQGFGSPLYAQPWPAYDENKLVADEVEIALQINGKVRGRLMVPSTMTREEGEKTLPQNPDVVTFTEGKSIMKIIFVPGRLLNLVVK